MFFETPVAHLNVKFLILFPTFIKINANTYLNAVTFITSFFFEYLITIIHVHGQHLKHNIFKN